MENLQGSFLSILDKIEHTECCFRASFFQLSFYCACLACIRKRIGWQSYCFASEERQVSLDLGDLDPLCSKETHRLDPRPTLWDT
jgi:hypothetical protein